MTIEISFPRGGRKPPPNAKPQDFQRDHDLFGHKRKKVTKHVEKTNLYQEKDDTSETTDIHFVQQLSGKTIKDGMILLGCVKEIQKVALEISLPGRLWGKVFINNLSRPYTKLLHAAVDNDREDSYKQLNELFTIGQCVAVKVLNLNDEKFGITLSMMPELINANISHTSVKAGMTLWGSIQEIEDHGYVVDLGINNCRAFLKKENCDVNIDYVVGQQLWFAVTKADISSTAATVLLNAKREKVKSMKIMNDMSLDHLLPGMQVDFTISQVLGNGLEGKFLNDYTGYIDVGQLGKSVRNNKEFKTDKVLQARIIYMMPVTKIVYFTLKSLEPRKREKLNDGAIINCKIQGVIPLGIYVKLTKQSRGFVPLYRARKNIPADVTQSDYNYLKRHYPKQSIHQCRVLNFDFFEQIYICTMERQLIKKDLIFNLDNVIPGDTVSAEILEIQSNGLLVRVEQINGYIKNEHICDTVLQNYNNVKSRLKVGQTVQARVWVINKEKNVLHLTMRPSLLSTELVLNDYQQAQENQQYLGIIKQITTNGLLIQFFGDIHGWVPKQRMKFGSTDTPDLLFKIGQLVKCTVVKRRNKKLTLSLQSSTEITKDVEHELKLGEHVDGIVSHITNEGIHIKVNNSDITAFIPTSYLSKFPKLAPIIAKMYNPGDEIFDLVCVSKNDSLPTLSLRNSELNEDNIQDIKTLKRGEILACSILTTDSVGMNLEAPINHYKKTILVPKENISDNHDVSVSDIKLNQLIYAKVFNINKNFESITASTKLSDVWDYDIQSSVQYFSEYMKEVLRIREHFKSLKSPLASLNLGEIVSGVIKKVNDDNSCIVQLDNGVKAVVHPQHVKKDLSANDKIEGIVLFWNFYDNTADIALCSKLITRINHLQTGNINIPAGVSQKSNAHAEVLLVKDEFVLGVLRGAAGKRQLIFFPARKHANDFKPYLNDYIIGDYINVQVSRIENGIIIGLLKQLVRDMNYQWRQNLKRKKELNSEEQPSTKRIKLENSNEEQSKNGKKLKEKKNKESEKKEVEKNKNVSNDEIQTKKAKKNKNVSTENIVEEPKQNKKNKKVSNDEEIQIKKEIIEEPKQSKKNKKISNDEEIQIKKEIIEEPKQSKKNKKISNDEEIQIKKEIIEEPKQSKKNKKVSNNEEIQIKKEITEDPKKIRKEKINTILNNDENLNKKTNNVPNEKENINNGLKEKKNKKEKQKKRKLDEENDIPETQINENKQKTKKSKQERIIEDAPIVLPGANNFWNISEESEKVSDESSDDEEQDKKELEKLQKKKKLTPAERVEAIRLEEERIRKIELELADAETTPKSADQFDRLVLANPNNSMYWINYMAFHLEATEIEKARSIARKALNTIEFREEQEKLNVWIAFLNLENRYGTKELFASVLEEAVKMNDSLSVYLQALNILSESKKTVEFLNLLKTVSRKFKQDFKMWTTAAEACYNIDLKDEARDLMQRSLKSLDEKEHINILVQFAFMEARHNEPERAEALLEKVLASYPRRVDVWTSYVDLLIKGNRIHIARNVLERAVGQKLPARKMKTLFSKYIQFETKFGDEEKVKKPDSQNGIRINYIYEPLNLCCHFCKKIYALIKYYKKK